MRWVSRLSSPFNFKCNDFLPSYESMRIDFSNCNQCLQVLDFGQGTSAYKYSTLVEASGFLI